MSIRHRIQATQKWVQSIVIGQKLCPFAPPLLQSNGTAVRQRKNNVQRCPRLKSNNDTDANDVKKFPKLRIHASESTSRESLITELTNEAHLLMTGDSTNITVHNIPSATCSTTSDMDIESLSMEEDTISKDPVHDHDIFDQNHLDKPETTLLVLHPSMCQSYREFIQLSWDMQYEAIVQNGYAHDLQLVLFHPLASHNTYAEELIDEDIGYDDAANYTIRSPYPTVHLLRELDVMKAMKSGYRDVEGIPSRNKASLRFQGAKVCKDRLKACINTNVDSS